MSGRLPAMPADRGPRRGAMGDAGRESAAPGRARERAAWEAAAGRDLVFIGRDLPRLRAEASGVRAARFARLVEECRRSAAAAKLPAEHPAESVTWVGIGAMNHALLWLLSGEGRWLDQARRFVSAAASWPKWGHLFLVDVDLSASWLLWGLGLCYDWFKDALPDDERRRLHGELSRHGRILRRFAAENEREGWPANWWQNHNWINLNGLATASYALAADSDGAAGAREYAEWAAYCRENFERVFSVMAPDGSDYEGTAYWRYGVPWLAAYAHMERRRGGPDFFAASAFMRETFWYRLYQAAPDLGQTMNFGDTHDTRSSHSIALYYKLASEYRIEEARWLADRAQALLYREHYESGIRPGILPEAGLEYLWFDPSVAPRPPDKLPKIRFFPDLGLLSARSSWEEDAVMLSVKAGPPGGETQWRRSWEEDRSGGPMRRGLSHQHPDDGAFLIFGRGSYLACDEGYSRELYLANHNAVTVDGQGYEGEGANNVWRDRPEGRIARLERIETDEGFFAFVCETSLCYAPALGVRLARRSIVSPKAGVYLVLDQLEAEETRTWTWNFHAEVFPEERDDGSLEYRNGAAFLRLRRLLPVGADEDFRETVVRSVMTPQEPEKLREVRLASLGESVRSAQAAFLHLLEAGSAFDPPRVEVALEGGLIRLRGAGFEAAYAIATTGLEAALSARADGAPRGEGGSA